MMNRQRLAAANEYTATVVAFNPVVEVKSNDRQNVRLHRVLLGTWFEASDAKDKTPNKPARTAWGAFVPPQRFTKCNALHKKKARPHSTLTPARRNSTDRPPMKGFYVGAKSKGSVSHRYRVPISCDCYDWYYRGHAPDAGNDGARLHGCKHMICVRRTMGLGDP